MCVTRGAHKEKIVAYKFLTPLQVWSGYNPVKEALEVSVVKTADDGDVHVSDMFYTVETVKDGKVRGYLRLVYLNSWFEAQEKHPAVLFLPARDEAEREIVQMLLEAGYVVAVVDYTGESPNKVFCTTYPKSLEYGNLRFAGDHLNTVTESALDTCGYLWTKVARRAITLVSQQAVVDPEKICICGEKLGAKTVWQIAGTDGRVKAAVPVLGGGYSEYEGKFKYSHNNTIEMTEERKCWLAGAAAQAYAQFVTCPVYFLTGTNSECTDFDRATDILFLTKSEEAILLACPMANRQISLPAVQSLRAWLSPAMGGCPVHEPPELSFEVTGGKLFLNALCSSEVTDIKPYYALGSEDPSGRNWRKPDRSSITGENRYSFELPVYDADERMFAFANVTFSDGVTISSKLITCVPKAEKVTALVRGTLEERIIFDSTTMGDTFVVESKSVFGEDNMLKIKEGPGGLRGATTEDGKLVTYKLQESAFSKNKASIIQLHAYCKEKRTISFVVTLMSDVTAYSADISLNCQGKWQRITLNTSDFKTASMRTLKEWSSIKKMEIVGAEDVLFNNILWV